MRRASRLRRRTWLIAMLISGLAPDSALAKPAYAEGGAATCIDCHDTSTVMGILKTAHAEVSDPGTPAARKECESCHGPSADHTRFPMQIENVHFGKGSGAAPEVQNQLCLECHENGGREAWRASAHGFEKVLCSQCHSMHDPAQVVPAQATVSAGCTNDACHGELMGNTKLSDFTHAIGHDLGGSDPLTCSDCHNPHDALNASRCNDCHSRTLKVVAMESLKAKRFHEVAERKGTECTRCHMGIAHPIPRLVLRESQKEKEVEVEVLPGG
jgi:hypothetical protein